MNNITFVLAYKRALR